MAAAGGGANRRGAAPGGGEVGRLEYLQIEVWC